MRVKHFIVFLLSTLLFSCKQDLEKDLNFLHLEEVTKGISDDFNSVTTDVLNVANIIQHKINFQKDVIWGPNKYQLSSEGVVYFKSDWNSSSVFLPIGVNLNQRLKNLIINSEPIDTLIYNLCRNNAIVSQAYFLDTNSFLRIYPYVDVLKQYLPQIKLTDLVPFRSLKNEPFFDENAYWIKDPYADPSGRGWIISCASPLYYRDQFIGIVSADIMMKTIYEKYLLSDSEMFLIINLKGDVICCTKKASSYFNIPANKEYPYYKPFTKDVFMSGNPSFLNNQSKNVRKAVEKIINGEIKVEFVQHTQKVTIYSSKIKETNWFLLKIIN